MKRLIAIIGMLASTLIPGTVANAHGTVNPGHGNHGYIAYWCMVWEDIYPGEPYDFRLSILVYNPSGVTEYYQFADSYWNVTGYIAVYPNGYQAFQVPVDYNGDFHVQFQHYDVNNGFHEIITFHPPWSISC